MNWNAFEAIGTTLGSFITAIAVIVAVCQYRQPLKKRMGIVISNATIDPLVNPRTAISIETVNKGMRPIKVCSICIVCKKHKRLWLLKDAQEQEIFTGTLPYMLQAEDSKVLFFNENKINNSIKKGREAKVINKKLVKFVITDSAGKEYIKKVRM